MTCQHEKSRKPQKKRQKIIACFFNFFTIITNKNWQNCIRKWRVSVFHNLPLKIFSKRLRFVMKLKQSKITKNDMSRICITLSWKLIKNGLAVVKSNHKFNLYTIKYCKIWPGLDEHVHTIRYCRLWTDLDWKLV